MTTKVTVTASGPCYPARVIHVRRPNEGPQREELNVLIASGETLDVWCGTSDTITITEEYHPQGYRSNPAGETVADAVV